MVPFIIRLLGLLFILPNLALAETTLNPLSVKAQAGDRVSIRGFKGNIDVLPHQSAKEVRVEASTPSEVKSDWNFTIKREGGEIQVVVESPMSKRAWNEALLNSSIQEYSLRVRMPHLPLDINWNEGDIKVTSLNADMRIVNQKGAIQILAGEGALGLSQLEGSVVVVGRTGDLNLDLYESNANISKVNGRIQLENFNGETRLQEAEGEVILTSYKGDSRISKAKGRLEFKNGNSALHVEGFDGEIRGNSQQGPVYLNVVGTANVRMETDSGNVHLRLPNSGAWVNLGTSDGNLAVPNFLKLTRLPSQQIRTGRLRGSSGGSIFIRTRTGEVRLR